MSKTPRKDIMKRSKLRNTFNKKRSSENWQNYKKSGKELSFFSLTNVKPPATLF